MPPGRDANPNVTLVALTAVTAAKTVMLFVVTWQKGLAESVFEKLSTQLVTTPVPMVMLPRPSCELAPRDGDPAPQAPSVGVPAEDIAVPSIFES